MTVKEFVKMWKLNQVDPVCDTPQRESEGMLRNSLISCEASN